MTKSIRRWFATSVLGSRRYGTVSSFESKRAVPTPAQRPLLALQRARLLSADTKVGKSRYE